MEPKKHDLEAVRKILEHYLSDENLKIDKYFQSVVENSQEKGVPLEVFMACIRIKKMGIEPRDLIEAVKDSAFLESNAENNGIKRKALPSLPHQKKETEENTFDPLVRCSVIFKFTTEKPSNKTWKEVQQYLKAKFGVEIPYIRFNKVDGHFAIEKGQFLDSLNQRFDFDGEKLLVLRCEDEELRLFYDLYGSHFQNMIERTTQSLNRKYRNDPKETSAKPKQIKPVTLGNHTFYHIEDIKLTFETLLQSTADNEEITEPNLSLLHDLLKYHDNYEQMVSDLKYFTAGPHPNFKDTRCFFIIRSNGEKEDINSVECYQKIEKIMAEKDE